MSFRDLETTGPRGGHASKQQPKQRRDEESAFEKNIKANIQEMQDNIRTAGDQLERATRGCMSKRMGESLDKSLERSRQLSEETDKQFREWTVHLAGEPSERQRKKFSYEKLQKAFEEEVMHLKDVARRAVTAKQEALAAPGTAVECRSVVEDQDAGGVEEEHGLLDDSDANVLVSSSEDSTMRSRIAQEREEGIRRIQNQVSEVNQIFRDLASIVHDQGQQIDSIENQAETAKTNTKIAVKELKKAVDRQRNNRERLCCMLAAAFTLLCFVLLPYLRASSVRHAPAVVVGESLGAGPDAALGSRQLRSKDGSPVQSGL